RQTIVRRADDGFRAAADADPGRQRSALDRREDALLRECGPGVAAPRHLVVAEQLHEQIELFCKQLVVLVERVAEERERLRERATAEDDLGAAARCCIQCRETLE